MILIGIGVVVAVLVIIGGTQRKKLAVMLKSKTNAVIDSSRNVVEEMELKIQNVKKANNDTLLSAKTLEGERVMQSKRLTKVNEDEAATIAAIKKLKESGDDEKGKAKVKTLISLRSQQSLLNESIESIQKKKERLEQVMEENANLISSCSVRLATIKATRSANSAIGAVQAFDVDGNSLDEAMSEAEDDIARVGVELDYEPNKDKEVGVDVEDLYDSI